ncbi:MAG: hypothetical protein NTW25_07660, partial [Candidatus Kapabacteria bacterium]|nr:hypothetical protein [Candidatus Kapabacteria bacterium]
MEKEKDKLKKEILSKILAFQNGSLKEKSNELFDLLGYKSNRLIDFDQSTFFENAKSRNININQEKIKSIEELHILFQITDDEIKFDKKSESKINHDFELNSYIFSCVKLKSKKYSRTELSEISREINKVTLQPIFILFQYDNNISCSIINRRYNKNNKNKDVLEKVTLIKDIDTNKPHRAHIDIIKDFSISAMKNIKDFNDLHKAWEKILDTKELNKSFYKEIANWYFWAMDNVDFPSNSIEDKEKLKSSNLIRLLTRFIFVWFIKEKGLVPEKLFNQNELKDILNELDINDKSYNYYQAILQNLFFATLNQKISDRKFANDGTFRENAKDYGIKLFYRYGNEFKLTENEVVRLFETVPFLNGGLFDCLDNSDTKEIIDGFSRNIKNQAKVPNLLFFGNEKEVDLSKYYNEKKKKDSEDKTTKPRIEKVRGLINILNSYKFTIAENTPLEQDIALDPELLGTVFENLLAIYNPETKESARKATGSFYTPREIVNYMVDESLISYLEQKLVDQTLVEQASLLVNKKEKDEIGQSEFQN